MGQTLSEPIREKHSYAGGDERHLYGASEMQGWRIHMEDAHTMELKLENQPLAFFAVYDGHGGSTAAKFAGENVHKRLASDPSFKSKSYEEALKHAYLGIDEDLRTDSNFFRDPSGCTAVSALITEDDKIIVANAGDSRAVMSVAGVVKPLSFDHKPQNEGESARIRAAGGFVEYGRVNGNLALSRALGDFEFKSNTGLSAENQIVTADPEITVHDPGEEDEFVVIACDGIWDCLTSQQVVDITRRLIAEKKELKEIAELIMEKCLAPDSDINGGVGCDNMTVVVIALLRGKTKEQWYDWVADRVEKNVGYETPKELPQLYAASRLAAAKDRWSAPNNRFGGGSRPNAAPFGGPGLGALAARLVGVGGANVNNIFHTSGGGIGNNLTFNDDSSEEYESEEGEHDGALRAPASKNPNDDLRDRIHHFDDREDDGDVEEGPGRKWTIDDDGDANMADQATEPRAVLGKSVLFNRRIKNQSGDAEDSDSDPGATVKLPVGLSLNPPRSIGSPLVPSPGAIQTPKPKTPEIQGEAPPPPKLNGTTGVAEKQLAKEPAGDKPHDVTKVEGALDKSEDPLIATSPAAAAA